MWSLNQFFEAYHHKGSVNGTMERPWPLGAGRFESCPLTLAALSLSPAQINSVHFRFFFYLTWILIPFLQACNVQTQIIYAKCLLTVG